MLMQKERLRRSAVATAERDGISTFSAEDIFRQKQEAAKKQKKRGEPIGMKEGKRNGAMKMLSALQREIERVRPPDR